LATSFSSSSRFDFDQSLRINAWCISDRPCRERKSKARSPSAHSAQLLHQNRCRTTEALVQQGPAPAYLQTRQGCAGPPSTCLLPPLAALLHVPKPPAPDDVGLLSRLGQVLAKSWCCGVVLAISPSKCAAIASHPKSRIWPTNGEPAIGRLRARTIATRKTMPPLVKRSRLGTVTILRHSSRP
jgi:hypothetical protein